LLQIYNNNNKEIYKARKVSELNLRRQRKLWAQDSKYVPKFSPIFDFLSLKFFISGRKFFEKKILGQS